MGPSVESSQNRSVIRAGAPHWGQGMVSGMVRSLPPRSSPSVAPSSATSLPARMRGARVSKQCRNELNLRVMRHRVAVCGQRSTGPDLRLSRRQLPTSPLDLRIGVTAVVRWHGPSAGQRVTSDSSDTIGQHWLTLLRREAFRSVDLATVRELAANVEPYLRADGTRIWSLMQLERQLRPQAYGTRRGGYRDRRRNPAAQA
jgi:hypothetical protein